MSIKIVILCAAFAVARAGYLSAPAVSYAAAPAVSYAAAPAVSYAAAPAVSYAAAAPTVSYHPASYARASAPIAAALPVAPSLPVAPALPIAAPALVGQQSNILRSYGNLGTVSTYAKTLATPFTSVTKSDIRVSNPGYSALAAPVAAVAAPAIAAPAVSYHGNAFGYAAAPAAAIGYGYGAGLGYGKIGLGYGAGLGYASGLGYAAPAVAHVSYTSTHGSYGW